MATVKSATRKAAIKALGMLYKRPSGIDLSKCVYCGDARQCLDHVPPLQYVYSEIDVNVYLEKGGELLFYPACTMCNGFLGSKPLLTLVDRLAFLYKKYAKAAEKTVWSDDDMSELGSNLLKMILNHESKRRLNDIKLRGILDSILLHGES